MRQLTRQAGEAESQRDELTARKGALEAEAAAQKARQEWARREQYKAAVAELEAARRELADLEAEAGPLPDKEKLRQAQGELAYLKTLEASQKEAQNLSLIHILGRKLMLHFPESSENGNMVLLHELGLSAEGDGSSDLPACIQKRNGHTGQPQVGLLIVQRIALLADALCLLQKDIGLSLIHI